MPHIRITALAAAAAVVIAFMLSPATAAPCGDGEAACPAVAQAAPMKLDNFMKTWKPVANSKRTKKTRTVRKPAARENPAEPAVAETAPPPATPSNESLSAFAAAPGKTVETDGVGIASFDEANEIDALADQVQVVAFNEVNEIDLAAPSPPPPAETAGQAMSAAQTPADHSWIGKLLLAAAGTIAIAGATRLLIA